MHIKAKADANTEAHACAEKVSGAHPTRLPRATTTCNYWLRHALNKSVFFTVTLTAMLSLTGCGKHQEIMVRPYSDHNYPLNTDFGRRLAERLNTQYMCATTKSDQSAFERKTVLDFEQKINDAFLLSFPGHTALSAIENILLENGAKCEISAKNTEKSGLHCTLEKNQIFGIMRLYPLKGWVIDRAWQHKYLFQYNTNINGNIATNLQTKLLSGECAPIDPETYQSTKTVKRLDEERKP